MKEETRSFIGWVEDHKKELFVAGVSAAIAVAIVIGYKNKKELLNMWKILEGKIKLSHNCTVKRGEIPPSVDSAVATVAKAPSIARENPGVSQLSQEISSHIRNLHEGYSASAEKISTAIENGFILQPGQTWVVNYTKSKTAA